MVFHFEGIFRINVPDPRIKVCDPRIKVFVPARTKPAPDAERKARRPAARTREARTSGSAEFRPDLITFLSSSVRIMPIAMPDWLGDEREGAASRWSTRWLALGSAIAELPTTHTSSTAATAARADMVPAATIQQELLRLACKACFTVCFT